VQIKAEGLTISGSEKQKVTWKPKIAQRLSFSVQVPTPELKSDGTFKRKEVKVTMGVSRKVDGAADAFEVKLPLRPDRVTVVEREVLELTGKLTVPRLSVKPRAGSVRRSVVVSDQTGILRMAAALDALRRAPDHSTKNRIDRARAYLGTAKLRELLGFAEGKGLLDREVKRTLEYIPEVIDSYGHVASWPGYKGSVSLTAHAMQFIVDAEEAGYHVDRGMRDKLRRTLNKALRSDYRWFISGESWFERTLALLALTASGRFEEAYFSELSRRARYLSNEGTANVLLTAVRAKRGGSSAAVELTKRLANDVTVRLYQGKEMYAGLKEGRTDRSALILPSESRTLAMMMRALIRADATQKKIPLMSDALVALAGTDGWGNTDADSAALLALAERLFAATTPKSTIRFACSGKSTEAELRPEQPAVTFATNKRDAISVELSGQLKKVAVLTHTQYLPQEDGSKEDPAQHGFVVERSLMAVKEGGAPAERTKLEKGGVTHTFPEGQIIEDHVRVINPKLHHYVAVQVPLAAGMELLNPTLATAPPEAHPSKALTRSPSYAAYYDDSVTFYYDTLGKGTYDFYFRVRAMVPGSFVQPAVRAELIYDRSVWGSSAGTRIEIKEKK